MANYQNVGKFKILLPFVAAVIISGCAPSVVLTVASVPNPVLLGGPSHIKTDRNDVDVEVESSRTETQSETYRRTEVKSEGANKASAAVLRATHGNDSLDLQLSEIKVGAYFFGFFSQGIQTNWIGIKGGVAKAGKEKKQ